MQRIHNVPQLNGVAEVMLEKRMNAQSSCLMSLGGNNTKTKYPNAFWLTTARQSSQATSDNIDVIGDSLDRCFSTFPFKQNALEQFWLLTQPHLMIYELAYAYQSQMSTSNAFTLESRNHNWLRSTFIKHETYIPVNKSWAISDAVQIFTGLWQSDRTLKNHW